MRDADKYGLDSDELNHVRATSLKEKNTQIPLMTGAVEILNWTAEQGIQNFVYTHKSDNAFQVLEDLGIRHHFTEILTSDSGFARKPSPEALLFLIENTGWIRKAPTILATVCSMWKRLLMRVFVVSICKLMAWSRIGRLFLYWT